VTLGALQNPLQREIWPNPFQSMLFKMVHIEEATFTFKKHEKRMYL
jgi:hypothetical protein